MRYTFIEIAAFIEFVLLHQVSRQEGAQSVGTSRGVKRKIKEDLPPIEEAPRIDIQSLKLHDKIDCMDCKVLEIDRRTCLDSIVDNS